MQSRLEHLRETRARARAALKALTDKATAEKRDFTPAENKAAAKVIGDVRELDAQIEEHLAEMVRAGYGDPNTPARYNSVAGEQGSAWATRAAELMAKMSGGRTSGDDEARAVTSGSVNVPSLIDPSVTAKSRPSRLVDLLVNRAAIPAYTFDYWRQTTRTTAAAPVADLAVKPTSTYTLTAVEDRCRVLAHLSQEVPIRLWQDNAEVIRWLEAEMVAGVYDALEAQVISGSGSNENLTGILTVAGTTQVAYATDVPTTLRKSITALESIGVTPNALVLNPADAEALDLLKEGAGGVGYLLDGYQNGTASSGNVLGTAQRVVSPSVPAGVAILADWNQVKLFIREQMRLDIDAGGVLFTKNAAVMRAEIRVGLGHLHPASFAIADLTP